MSETQIAQWRPRVRMYAQDGRMRATFVTSETDGDIILPRGDKGAAGLPGLDSRPWILDSSVATESALPTTWTLADRGKAVAILDTKQFGYWTGTRWIVGGSLSVPGAAGAPLRIISGRVDTVDASVPSCSASLNGVDGGTELSLTIPRGPVGDPGPAGPTGKITGASDMVPTAATDSISDGAALTQQGGYWGTEAPSPSAEITSMDDYAIRTGQINANPWLAAASQLDPRPWASRVIVTGELRMFGTNRYSWTSMESNLATTQQVWAQVWLAFPDGSKATQNIGVGRWNTSNGWHTIKLTPTSLGTNDTIDANVTAQIQILLFFDGNPTLTLSGCNVNMLRLPLE